MILVILITVSMAQYRTSINSCTNEKTIFKLDIRQRVSNLPPNSTIKDLNASALCLEAYMSDYIWLQQLWTPGQFNYNNVNGTPEQTNDYRELQSIKEYSMDPQLGQLSELYLLQTNIKINCPHMKFLGEFSFYISSDSYLLQNVTRFLRKPASMSKNSYNSRYDNDNFVWAVNDQMKTIPYAVPWNYFDPIVINDMKDIIYRVVIDQHKLDGIVFLQPSLGLYSVMSDIFQPEVEYFGISTYLQDFYSILGLKSNSQTLFFMGGEDNLNTKIFLQNYLQQIYGNPSSKVWADMNYTLDPQGTYAASVDAKTIIGTDNGNQGKAITQGPPTSPTCMTYQVITGGNIQAGIYNTQNYRYVLQKDACSFIVQNGSLRYNGGGLLDDSPCFRYYEQDIIEIQYDQSIEQFIFMKYSIDFTNFQQISIMIPGGQPNFYSVAHVQGSSKIQIKFPFQFSQKYKNTNLVIQNSQQITILSTINYEYYNLAQIWPNINQNEDIVTLNFKVSNLASGNFIVIGVCNQETVNKNGQTNHHEQILGSGLYMWHAAGYTWRSSIANNANIQLQYGQGHIIGVSYIKLNSSILFYKNSVYAHQFPLTEKIKNLNFCVGLLWAQTVINLEY